MSGLYAPIDMSKLYAKSLSDYCGEVVERVDFDEDWDTPPVVIGKNKHQRVHTRLFQLASQGEMTQTEDKVTQRCLIVTVRMAGNRAVRYRLEPDDYGNVLTDITTRKNGWDMEKIVRFEPSDTKCIKFVGYRLRETLSNGKGSGKA